MRARTRVVDIVRLLLVGWSLLPAQAEGLSARTQEVCPDCIRLTQTVVLGDVEGPGYVNHAGSAVRDSLGRYWLGQYHDMIKVFDAKGKFVRTVGRRGAGPGEFDNPHPVFTDASGRVHVIDVGVRRETIFRPDFALDTIRRFPVGAENLAPLADGQGFVANSAVQSIQALGHPLHVVRNSQVLRSFGGTNSGVTDPLRMPPHVVTVDRGGRIYSAAQNQFMVDVWTEDGRKVTTFRGPPLRDDDPDALPADRARGVPRSAIAALSVDRQQRLWILVVRPRADWRDHMNSQVLASGITAFSPIDGDISGIYWTEVIVVDLSRGAIVGRVRRDELFMSFVGPESALEVRQLPNGIPQLAVWKVEWIR